MLEFRYKILGVKQHIILVFVSLSSLCYSQKTLQNFEGDLLFKESNYYFPLTRKTYDTSCTYYSYSVNKQIINIERISPMSSQWHETVETQFLPIIFFINGDSLFVKYQEKYSDVSDTVVSKSFPLNFKDTIEVPFCYRITEDTIRWKDTKRTLEVKTECDGDEHYAKTYRLKDTIITFKDFKIDCYSFEQKGEVGYKDVIFKRKILVDKFTLIPIDVKEYNFHLIKRPCFRHIIYTMQGQNFLTKHKKLISIEE